MDEPEGDSDLWKSDPPAPPGNERCSTKHMSIVFSWDDILYSKWPELLREFLAWLTNQALHNHNNYDILAHFAIHLTGVLRDWGISLSEIDQVNFFSKELSEAIRIMHQFFIGDPEDFRELKRREFFQWKCCIWHEYPAVCFYQFREKRILVYKVPRTWHIYQLSWGKKYFICLFLLAF